MAIRTQGGWAIGTLILSTAMHAFTHAFGAMLVPLYLLIQADFHLPGVKRAALVVTIYGTVYALLSYPAGVLADRVSRRRLLGLGLLLNALAIALMGLTRHYEALVGLAVLAGIGGTVYHPAANALVAEHFPKTPGMAIGLLGMGSGLGFFAGPRYAGLRAQTATWQWRQVSNWQRPCVELGAAGVVMAVLFLLLAREARPASTLASPRRRTRMEPRLRKQLIAIALVLGCRDFAGVASLSLASIFLQRAMGLGAGDTGLLLGAMMLMGIVANPLAVWLSPGARRIPGLTVVLILAGLVVAATPLFPTRAGVWMVLCVFQAMQLGSYAMSDAAMLERVPADLRGRVVGLFLSIAGTLAGLSPWLMGAWTDAMGPRAAHRLPYLAPFGMLGAMMMLAAFSTPIIGRLGAPDASAIDPLSEIMPATLEVV